MCNVHVTLSEDILELFINNESMSSVFSSHASCLQSSVLMFHAFSLQFSCFMPSVFSFHVFMSSVFISPYLVWVSLLESFHVFVVIFLFHL